MIDRPRGWCRRPTVLKRIARLANQGLSMRDVADKLGVSKNTIVGCARDFDIWFMGIPKRLGGCNSAQALKGWDTRWERGWHWKRSVPAADRRR